MKDLRKFVAQNKLLAVVISYLVVVLVALPLTLLTVQDETQTRPSAAAATTLSFTPASYQASVGDSFGMDVMVNPGTNAVSFITLDINYDPAKLSAGNTAFTANQSAFPAIIEGPVYESGRIRVKVSIGADPTKAIISTTKIGTVTFTALADTGGSTTQLTHGDSSYVLSVAPGDNATDNVLATKQPAAITIGGQGGGPTATTAPTGNQPTATTAPTATSAPTIIPTGIGGGPTNTPTPSCTPMPVECAVEGANCTPPANGYCTGEPTPTSTNGGPTPTSIPISCQKVQPADIALVIDGSGSMRGDKIHNAKQSAKSFVEILQKDSNNRVALVTFAKTATVNVSLTNDFSGIENAINNITLRDWTCTKCALDSADDELKTNGRADAKKIIVLLTDGKANTGGSGSDKQKAAEEAAVNSVKNAKTTGLIVYTIGIGNDVNPAFLQELAGLTGGAYYFAASPIEINDTFINVYTSLNNAICSGHPIIASITLPITPSADGGNINTVSIIMLTLLLIPVLMLLGHMFL